MLGTMRRDSQSAAKRITGLLFMFLRMYFFIIYLSRQRPTQQQTATSIAEDENSHFMNEITFRVDCI